MTIHSTWKGALNFRQGRAGMQPGFICPHIMDGTLDGTDSWFNNPQCKVSAHSGIGRGQVHDYVHSADTAFAVGTTEADKGPWKYFKRTPAGVLINPNFYTLNLEHEGKAGNEISDDDYRLSAGKCRFWHDRYNIPMTIDRYVKHSDIYPGHGCPGKAVIIEKLVELVKFADPIMPE